MEVTHVEFMHPGSFFAESSSQPVARRELPEAMPGRVTGYRFFTRQEAVIGGEKLVGPAKDFSPWTYFGIEYSAEQVQAMAGDRYRILRDNVRINGYKRMVQTTYGSWYPLHDGDTVRADA